MTPTTAQSLYRTWRSRTFDEVVGQGHIMQTLRNAVRANSVGHAYLLTGPRGTGKTSTARILARAVNCLHPRDGEPCNECQPCRDILSNRCLDVMEIDAASKSKVDEMRDVIDKVGYAPTEVRRKVYIVDEVHMLSTSAFNAILKTLEEPPAHAIFMLATTDVHKVPTTITSRCQRLDFRTISARDIVERLDYVCQQEGLRAERPALEVIAQQATGSLRDALSLLEQVRAYEDAHIGLAEVEDALGLARRETLVGLADSIVAGDAGAALALIGDLAAAGTDLRQYAKQLVQYWRDLLLLRVGAAERAREDGLGDPAMAAQAARLTPADITAVLKAILQPDYSGRRGASAQWQLELAVVEASARFASGESRPAEARVPAVAAPVAAPAVAPRAAGRATPSPAAIPAAATAIASAPPDSALTVEPVVRPEDGPTTAARMSPPSTAAVTPAPESRDRQQASAEQRRPPVSDSEDEAALMATRAAPAQEGARPAETPAAPTPAPRPVPVPTQRAGSDDHDAQRVWAQVRQHQVVRGKAGLAKLLEDSCTPGGLDNGSFVLLFGADSKSRFMQDRVMAQQNRTAIEEALQAVVGQAVTLRCDTLRQQSSAGGAQGQTLKTDPFVEETARRLRAVHMDRK